MKITVLGSSAAYAGASDACSGYLIEHGSTKLLLDCGTGVASSLQRHIDFREVTHIAISHMHADHFFDLIPLYFAFWRTLGRANGGQPCVLLPSEGLQTLRSVVSAVGLSSLFLEQVFLLEEYHPHRPQDLGELEVELTPTEHFIPSYAITVRGGGRKVAYSADTRPCPGLVGAAKGADLFLCEATIFDPSDREGRQGHMTAYEAGETAQLAGARHLVLTHFWPECDRKKSCSLARSAFHGSTEIAYPGLSFTL